MDHRNARRERLVLTVIILVGLALRVAYLGEMVKTPEFSAPAVDPEFHDYWARGIVTGDWTPPPGRSDPQITTTPYLRPPGYPYFLSMIYMTAGTSYLAPRLVQIFLGLLNILLAFHLARRWYGGTVALVFAALMASYWILIYFEAQLQEPTLLIFLSLAALHLLTYWVRRKSWYYAFLGGAALGLAAVVRANALGLIATVVLWLLWYGYRQSARRRAALAALGVVVGSAVVIAPITIRNYLVARDVVLISSNAGVNLYIGNNERADGLYYGRLPDLREFGTCFDYPRIVRQLEIDQARPFKYSEVSEYFTKRAIRFIRDHPARVLRLMLTKAALFWGPHEISHNRVIHYERAFSGVLRNIPGNFPFVVSLFVLGVIQLVFDRRRAPNGAAAPSSMESDTRWLSILIILFIVAYFLTFLPFFNAAHYRVPVVPLLLLFGAYGLCCIGRLVSARNLLALALWVVVWAGMYLLARTPFVPYEPDLAEWLAKRGAAYHRLGDLDHAVAAFRESLENDPDEPRTYCGLAIALAEAGRTDEAIAAWTQALRIEPDRVDAHVDLASALSLVGRIEEAARHYARAVELHADLPAPYINLASLLMAQGEFDQAVSLYRQAIRLAPNAPEAYFGLGLVFARKGDLSAAVQYYREALRRQPDFPEAHVNLGQALKEQGRLDEAITQYMKALRLRPNDAPIHHNLGAALYDLGKIEEAIDHYQTALDLRPDLTLTLRCLGKALLEIGNPADAVKHLTAACRLRPDDIEAHRALAQAYEQQGNRDAAVDELRTILRLAPHDRQASDKLGAWLPGKDKP